MLRVAAAGALVLSLGFVAPGAARAPDCATAGHTVIANKKARVYRVGNDSGGKYYGCTYGSERRKLLGGYSISSEYQSDTVFIRLRGRRVGYANVSYAGTSAWEAKVVDLRTRKVTRRTFADGGIDDLQMTGSGSLALLTDDGATRIDGDGIPNEVQAYTVIKLESEGGTVLDRGKDVDPDSLAVARHRVYWARADEARSAPIE